MYTYQYAIVKHQFPDARIEEVDVRTASIGQLFNQYSEVYLVLTHPVLAGVVTLVMSSINAQLTSLPDTVTVEQWLTDNGDNTLPTQKGKPHITTHMALSRDIWQAGYVADLCVPSGSPLNEANDFDKTDIWLRRDDTDYIDVQRHCLATVNGYVHRLDADHQGAYIKEGGSTFRCSEKALLGLISFKNLGRLHTYSITPDMVYNLDPARLFSDSFYMKLPFDATKKVVGIVIGGYLHLNSTDVRVTGPRTIKVDMKRIPFLERYMESRYDMNLTRLERFHEVSPTNPTDYDLQGFFSNECMLELLTLSQSFLVSLDVEQVSMKVVDTARSHLPGRFYHDGEEPLWPLRTQLGRLPSYLKELENGVWVLKTDNNLHQHRLFNTFDTRHHIKVDEKRIASRPQTFHRGELIQFSTTTVTIE